MAVLCSDGITTLTWRGQDVEVVRDSWVVRMPQTNAATAQNAADYRSLEPAVPAGWGVRNLGLGFFSIDAPGWPSAEVAGWAATAGVAFHQPNFVVRKAVEIPNEGPVTPPANPGFGSLWGLKNTGQPGVLDKSPTANLPGPGTPGADIDVTSVWAEGFTGSRDVIVAVLDDGIDYTHADLQANMWTRPANVPADRYGLHGWDSAGGDGDVRSPNLTDAHGTHVAGTIGAQGNNGLGITGVMQEVLLYGAKVFGDGAGGASQADQIDAITRIVDLRTTYGQNIVAINASLGGVGPENPARTQIIAAAGAAGILFVAAAGNNASNNDFIPFFPANTPAANVISVAASNRQDELTSFSNFGQVVSIAAPGSGVWSTVPGDAYDEYPGTSMAAPHVAGVAGLVAAAYLETRGTLPSVAELKAAILDGADVIPTVPGVSGLTNPTTRGFVNGNRRLNAFGALKEALSSIVISDATIAEGNAGQNTVQLTVALATAAERQMSVRWATRDGTARASDDDYVATSGEVVFAVGEKEKSIQIVINGDRWREGDELFEVVLSDPDGAVISDGLGKVTIENDGDSAAYVQVLPGAVVESTGSRGSVMEFNVRVRGDALAPFSLSYATRDGSAVANSDYRPNRGTIRILPGQPEKRIAVSVFGDRALEQDEYLWLDTSTGNDPIAVAASPSVNGIILDDDSRFFTIRTVTAAVAAGSAFQFQVGLSRRPGYGEALPSFAEFGSLPSGFLETMAGQIRFTASYMSGHTPTAGVLRRPRMGTPDVREGTVSLGYTVSDSGAIATKASDTFEVQTDAVARRRPIAVQLFNPANATLSGLAVARGTVTPALAAGFASLTAPASATRLRRR
jgi:subtilisin family serine protease